MNGLPLVGSGAGWVPDRFIVDGRPRWPPVPAADRDARARRPMTVPAVQSAHDPTLSHPNRAYQMVWPKVPCGDDHTDRPPSRHRGRRELAAPDAEVVEGRAANRSEAIGSQRRWVVNVWLPGGLFVRKPCPRCPNPHSGHVGGVCTGMVPGRWSVALLDA